MDQDTILGIVRHILTSAGGALVTDGIVSQSQLADGVGAVVLLLGIGWSIWNKYQHRQALAAAKGAAS